MQKGLITVLMPAYNAEATIGFAIKSLLHQSYGHWQLIIIDDGSSDGTAQVVESFLADRRIQFFKLDKNQGRGKARQAGLKWVKGEFLAFLDADDMYHPHKLELQLKALQNNSQWAGVSTAMFFCDDEFNLLGRSFLASTQFARLNRPQFIALPFAPFLFDRSKIQSFRFDSKLKSGEDFDLLLQIMMQYPVGCLDQPLYAYRFEANRKLGRRMSQLKYNLTTFNKFFSTHPLAVLKMYLEISVRAVVHFVGRIFALDSILAKKNRHKVEAANQIEFKKIQKIAEIPN